MKKNDLAAIITVLILFAIAIYLYPSMPDRMAEHWNERGEANGYTSKFWGLFLLPIISLVMFFLFLAIPKIDPLKENIRKFRKYYNGFVLMFIFVLSYIYLLTVFWNLGIEYDFIRYFTPVIGLFFYYTGVLLGYAKKNWFVGIRTPWTMSSDRVWNKTHNIAGRLFKISGLIAILGIFFRDFAVWFIAVPVIFTALFTIIYSYLEYQKENKR